MRFFSKKFISDNECTPAKGKVGIYSCYFPKCVHGHYRKSPWKQYSFQITANTYFLLYNASNVTRIVGFLTKKKCWNLYHHYYIPSWLSFKKKLKVFFDELSSLSHQQ